MRRVILREDQASQRIAAADDANDDHDDRNDQEDVDESTQRIRGHHPEQPQNHQQDCNSFQQRPLSLTVGELRSVRTVAMFAYPWAARADVSEVP